MPRIDPSDQEYYDDYFDLFASKGWKRFIEDLEVSLENDQKTAVARCDTNEKWHVERGAQGKALRILALQNSLEMTYAQLTKEMDDSSELED